MNHDAAFFLVSERQTVYIALAVVGALIAIGLSAFAIKFVVNKRSRRMRSRSTAPIVREHREVNELYGTYYNGVGYITVNDNNDLYATLETEENTNNPEEEVASNSLVETNESQVEPIVDDDGYARIANKENKT